MGIADPHWQVPEAELAAAVDTIPENALVAVGYIRLKIGDSRMPQPCRSCDRREIDWGGCRCQAFLLTGNAGVTDPACSLSPDHHLIGDAVSAERALELVPRRR